MSNHAVSSSMSMPRGRIAWTHLDAAGHEVGEAGGAIVVGPDMDAHAVRRHGVRSQPAPAEAG